VSYIGKSPAVGNFVKLDAISTSSTNTYNLTLDSVAFTPESANHMLVSLNGVIQAPLSSFSVSGSTITFLPSSGTLSSSDSIDFIMVYGNVLDIGTPSDSTVTNAKTNFVSTSSSAGLQIKGDNTTGGTLQLNCEQNSHGIKLRSPAHSAGQSYTLTFPTGNVTAGKFLKVDSVSGSGATGVGQLSFDDAGGGSMTFLSATSLTSASSVTINPPFSSTFTAYKIIIAGMAPATTNQDIFCRFIKSDGTEDTSNDYRRTIGGFRESTTSTEGSGSADRFVIGRNVHNDTGTLSADILITNPQQALRTSVIGMSNKRFVNDAYAYAELIGCWMNSSQSYTQIKFFPASGNFQASGKIMVYGLKES